MTAWRGGGGAEGPSATTDGPVWRWVVAPAGTLDPAVVAMEDGGAGVVWG